MSLGVAGTLFVLLLLFPSMKGARFRTYRGSLDNEDLEPGSLTSFNQHVVMQAQNQPAPNTCGKVVEHCDLQLQICGNLVNKGHGGNTEIWWARDSNHSNLDPSKESEWLLVKTTKGSGEPECDLQKRFTAAGGSGPRCHAGCEDGSGKGTVVLDAVLSSKDGFLHTASDIGSALQEWQPLKTSDPTKYLQLLRTLMQRLLGIVQQMLEAKIFNFDQNEGNVLIQKTDDDFVLKAIDLDPDNFAKYFADGVPDVLRNFAGLGALSLTFCPVHGGNKYPNGDFALTPWCEDAKRVAVSAGEVPEAVDTFGANLTWVRESLRLFSTSEHWGAVFTEYMEPIQATGLFGQ